jgi:transcriptional regulator with XRE-family HTH domain
MLSIIFKNPELAAKKLNISQVAIYSWLKGSTPKLATMMKLYEVYEIKMTLEYMYNFFTLINSLLRIEDNLDQMLYKIDISSLDGDDKLFLKEFIKAKYWKKINGK